jgi:hypothetical protein
MVVLLFYSDRKKNCIAGMKNRNKQKRSPSLTLQISYLKVFDYGAIVPIVSLSLHRAHKLQYAKAVRKTVVLIPG